MNRKFFEKFGHKIHKKLAEHGATFSDLADEPDRLFLGYGYTKKSQIAIPKAITDFGLLRIPFLIRKLVFGKLIAGYSVYHFTYGE